MGSQELDVLLQGLSSGDDDQREAAALALGRLGQPAVASLVAMLATNEPDVRWWVARALAEVGSASAGTALVQVLNDPDPDVRACAALGLGRIGDEGGALPLAASLADESPFVAGIAADALTMIGEGAVAGLATALSAESAHVRLLAVRALGRIRSEKAIGPIFGALEDNSYLVRYYAHEALEAHGVGMLYLKP
jgi:HEAT repeat protein